jgi:hypothetical protein
VRLENWLFWQIRETWWTLRNVSATVANSYWTGVLLLLAAVLLLALYLLSCRCAVLLSVEWSHSYQFRQFLTSKWPVNTGTRLKAGIMLVRSRKTCQAARETLVDSENSYGIREEFETESVRVITVFISRVCSLHPAELLRFWESQFNWKMKNSASLMRFLATSW